MAHIRKVFIFDNDGTMFPETPEMKENFRDSVVQAALNLGLAMSRKDANAVALDSQNTYNMSAYRFIKEFGMDRIELFREYNALLNPDFIPTEHARRLKTEFSMAAIGDKADRALMSYATREWVLKALDKIKAPHVFDDDKIVTAEDFDYQPKADSDLPFNVTLARLNATPEQATIFEDSKGALKRAAALGFEGRRYIHNHSPFETLPAYLTAQHADLCESLKFYVP